MIDTDVAVVGMGPVGTALAGLLGQRGIDVVVVDRLPDLYPLPRAVGLDHDVMRVVQELGVADRVEPYVSPYRPSEYLGSAGQLIRRLDAAPPPHRVGWSPNYVFEQPAFECILRARLADLPTVTPRTCTDVRRVGQDGERAWIDLVNADGEAERLHAQFVVACDGGSSPTRKQLGIDLEDLGFDEPWLVVDVIVDDATLARLPQTQVQYCEPARPCTYVVGVGNHRRWEIRLGDGDRDSGDWPESELWPLLRRWITPGDGRIWRSAAYRFHGLVAREWRRGRVLLAGDAAHMTPPFMAQGMAQGMRDAQNLAWKLSRVIRHGAPATLLNTYEQERKPHVTATTRTAMDLGQVICERDPDRAVERDARLLAEQGGVVRTVVRQELIPALCHGLIDTTSAGAGVTLPQPVVTAGHFRGRLDDLTGPVVRVVALERLSSDQRAAFRASLAPVDGVLVELGTGPDGLVAEASEEKLLEPWLVSLGARFLIARPDHYVFATAQDVDGALLVLGRLVDAIGVKPMPAREPSILSART